VPILRRNDHAGDVTDSTYGRRNSRAAARVCLNMQIEVWSDVVCPWCFIGKRRLDEALARFEHRADVEVVYRSFELDPSTPVGEHELAVEHLGRKYGAGSPSPRAVGEQMTERVAEVGRSMGIEFDYSKAVRANTFDAHRLLHLALAAGGPELQRVLADRLFDAYFTQGAIVDDHATLQRIAESAGLDTADVAAVLASDKFADDVRADVAQARAYGASGVPFFVLDKTFGISGAQPLEVFAAGLQQAWEARKPALVTVTSDAAVTDDAPGEVCGPDGCEPS
jgi:predicted DsbA family dithiol-disulfide isomerase